MTIAVAADGTILLAGHCPSDDAEPLLRELVAAPSAAVDWRDCQSAHSAVVQVLLVAHRQLVGPPASPALKMWVQPLLEPSAPGNGAIR